MSKVFLLESLKMENIQKMDFSWIKRKFMKVTLIKELNKAMES